MSNIQSSTELNVGFVGLGAMGFGMATHLVNKGYKVTGFDVFPQAVERFQNAGGIGASSLVASAEGKAFYICMVASSAQLEPMMFEGEKPLVHTLAQGVTFLVASTVAAHYVENLQRRLNELGRQDILLVDCPVSGGAKRAADGTLSIMAGGSKDALDSAMPLLSAMSDANKLFLPGGIGAGSNLKMVHQVLAAIQILATSEAMGLASYLKLDLESIRQKVLSSSAYSWMFENRSPRIVSGQFVPVPSALTIILKDVGIITEAARLEGFPVPLCSAAEQTYLTGLLQGFGAEDDAGMVRVYCPKFATPESSPVETLTSQDLEERMSLIISLLSMIHAVAAAEAISFAHHLSLDLRQFVTLVNDAAGATMAFRTRSPYFLQALGVGIAEEPNLKSAGSIEENIAALSKVLQKARELNCPLHLGNATLAVLTTVRRQESSSAPESAVLRYYTGTYTVK